MKPNVTRAAALLYGFDLQYHSRPSWGPIAGLMQFAARIRRDLGDLRPSDMIDIQSFMWIQGSEGIPELGPSGYAQSPVALA
jgi:hypothetical protein